MATVTFDKQENQLEKVLIGGSFIESMGGLGAVVLAILGLVGVAPHYMAAIATILIGCGLAFGAGGFAAEYSGIVSRMDNHSVLEKVRFGSGVGIEAMSGIGAIVLGILSLLAIDAAILLPVAAIMLGGTLILTSGALSQINSVRLEVDESQRRSETIALAVLAAATVLQVFMGFAAMALGIIALTGIHSLVLTLVAMLIVGASVLLTGAAVCRRMVGSSGYDSFFSSSKTPSIPSD
jgi:hypothetical protein